MTTYNVEIIATVALGNTLQSATQTFSVTVVNVCSPTTVTQSGPASGSYSYTLMDPQASYTMNPFTVSNEPAGYSCVTYSLMDSSNTSPFVNSYITMTTFPTLLLGPTTGSELGTSTSQTFSIKVRADVAVNSVYSLWPVDITIINPCGSATISVSTASVSVSYTVGGTQATSPLTFTVSPSYCAVTYAASYSSNPSSVFSFPSNSQLAVGPTSDVSIASTTSYTVSMQATATYSGESVSSASKTQTFSVSFA